MRAAWRVFFTCWIVYSVFWTPYIVREHFPAITLAESGTLNVRPFLGFTDDIFPVSRGAVINNNPGASIAGAMPLLLLRPLTARIRAWNLRQPEPPIPPNDGEFFWRTVRLRLQFYFLFVAFATVALCMAPATAATAAFFCARLQQFGISACGAASASLLYALATPMFFRAGLLNHNTLVADAAFTALLLLWNPAPAAAHPACFEPAAGARPSQARARLRALPALLAGLLAGYCVLCDWSGVVVLAVTSIYCVLRCFEPLPRKLSTPGIPPAPSATAAEPARTRVAAIVAFSAGALVCIAALAFYQHWAFGSPILPSQHYMRPTAPTARGYRGFDWPSPALAWANFFDPRFGLFAYCPVLMLGLAAPLIPRARRLLPTRELLILVLYFILFVLFCAANQYSWLQPLTGFRYLVPVIPPLAIISLEVARQFPRSIQALLAACACAQSLILAAAHENDVRTALGTLVERRGQLFWMMRLRDAGLPLNWSCTLAALLVLAVAVFSIWAPWARGPAGRRVRAAPAQLRQTARAGAGGENGNGPPQTVRQSSNEERQRHDHLP